MRLTAQVISDAPIVLNCEGKLTLQLRNLQIPYIENLSTTQNRFSVIDLTNNEIIDLEGIPENFTNLQTVLLGNNNITRISSELSGNNHIESMSLINNNLKQIDTNFSKFHKLHTLCLLNNPVCQLPNYRLFMIWLVPSLKVLDFARVRPSERARAEELFGVDRTDYNEVALSLLNKSVEGEKFSLPKHVVSKLSEQDRKELLQRLQKATSIDEIEQIESALLG